MVESNFALSQARKASLSEQNKGGHVGKPSIHFAYRVFGELRLRQPKYCCKTNADAQSNSLTLGHCRAGVLDG